MRPSTGHLPAQRAQAIACLLVAAALALVASAAEHIEVDQPEGWYRLDASHHGKHALGGLALGAVAFETTSLATDDRGVGYASAAAVGFGVGIGYELVAGRDGQSWVDPVDAAYVGISALLGAALMDLTHHALSIIVHRDGGSVAVAYSF